MLNIIPFPFLRCSRAYLLTLTSQEDELPGMACSDVRHPLTNS